MFFFITTERTDINTPAVVASGGTLTDRCLLKDEKKERKKINYAISEATKSLGLVAGTEFESRVLQLAQLSSTHKTVSNF